MSLWPASKSLIKRSLAGSRVLRHAGRFVECAVAILMYHSVMDDPQAHAYSLGDIIHSTATFRKHMELIGRSYHPVTLDDVLLFVSGEKHLPPRAVVVTFDDGYADNAEVVAPVLERYGIPGVFYLTVDCVDNASPPWVASLRYAFATTKHKLWPDQEGKLWPLSTPEQRNHAFLAACETCARTLGAAQRQFVQAIDSQLESSLSLSQHRLMMSWQQARQLIRRGHTVGSHTMTHPNLAHVKDEEMRLELAHSKQRLEQELAAPVHHFAYPCPILQPHWTPATVAVCRRLGYRTAVTTNSGPVHKGDNPLYLRRVPAATEAENFRWKLDCTFLGRSL